MALCHLLGKENYAVNNSFNILLTFTP